MLWSSFRFQEIFAKTSNDIDPTDQILATGETRRPFSCSLALERGTFLARDKILEEKVDSDEIGWRAKHTYLYWISISCWQSSAKFALIMQYDQGIVPTLPKNIVM